MTGTDWTAEGADAPLSDDELLAAALAWKELARRIRSGELDEDTQNLEDDQERRF